MFELTSEVTTVGRGEGIDVALAIARPNVEALLGVRRRKSPAPARPRPATRPPAAAWTMYQAAAASTPSAACRARRRSARVRERPGRAVVALDGFDLASSARTAAARPSAPTTTSTSAPGAVGTHGTSPVTVPSSAILRRCAAGRAEPGLHGPAGLDVAGRLGRHVRRAGVAGGQRLVGLARAVDQVRLREVAEQRHAGQHAAELGDTACPPSRRGRRRRPLRRVPAAGPPASTAVGHRSGSSPPSSASRAASTVLKRDSAPRAASLRTPARRSARSSRDRLAFLGAQLRERDPLVQPRLRRQAKDALADHVAEDLLGPARGLQPRQVGHELAPMVVGQPVGARPRRTSSSPAAIAALIVVTLAARPRGPGCRRGAGS